MTTWLAPYRAGVRLERRVCPPKLFWDTRDEVAGLATSGGDFDSGLCHLSLHFQQWLHLVLAIPPIALFRVSVPASASIAVLGRHCSLLDEVA
jgi:hypothetical protein